MYAEDNVVRGGGSKYDWGHKVAFYGTTAGNASNRLRSGGLDLAVADACRQAVHENDCRQR